MAQNKALSKLGSWFDSKFTLSPQDLLIPCLQEWARDAKQSQAEQRFLELTEFRAYVEQLSQERLALAEQLTIVYQQLDAVTDTLQKELKTKEELAKELRDANEQIFSSNFGGGASIDIASIIAGSRPSTPSSLSHREGRPFLRVPSESGRSEDKGSTGFGSSLMVSTPRQRGGLLDRTKSPLPEPKTSRLGAGRAKTPPKSQSPPAANETSVLSPDSLGESSAVSSACNWGTALPRMREQGILRGDRL